MKILMTILALSFVSVAGYATQSEPNILTVYYCSVDTTNRERTRTSASNLWLHVLDTNRASILLHTNFIARFDNPTECAKAVVELNRNPGSKTNTDPIL